MSARLLMIMAAMTDPLAQTAKHGDARRLNCTKLAPCEGCDSFLIEVP
jgi:hypothetical protein